MQRGEFQPRLLRKKVSTRAVDTAGEVCSFTRRLQSVFINAARANWLINHATCWHTTNPHYYSVGHNSLWCTVRRMHLLVRCVDFDRVVSRQCECAVTFSSRRPNSLPCPSTTTMKTPRLAHVPEKAIAPPAKNSRCLFMLASEKRTCF